MILKKCFHVYIYQNIDQKLIKMQQPGRIFKINWSYKIDFNVELPRKLKILVKYVY